MIKIGIDRTNNMFPTSVQITRSDEKLNFEPNPENLRRKAFRGRRKSYSKAKWLAAYFEMHLRIEK